MKLWKNRAPAITPMAEYTAAMEHRERQRQHNAVQMRLCVSELQKILAVCPLISESIEGFDAERLQRPRIGRNPLKVANFLDGFVVIGTVREGGIDSSHQLTVSDTKVTYNLTTVDAAFRVRTAPDTYLDGIDQIAAEGVAINGITHLYDATVAEASQGWPHTCSLNSGLELARRPVGISA